MNKLSERVAIVGGVRTPFVKAQTKFSDCSLQELGAHVLKELVDRYEVSPEKIDEFIFGAVLLNPRTPNWAREILFASGLPKSIYAHSVSNNCISGLVAITDAADRIRLGMRRCAIAGGVESMSNPTFCLRETSAKKYMAIAGARSLGAKLAALSSFRLRDFLPEPPGIKEPSTGLSMGEHMEITAKELGISRSAQDEVALHSHQNAHAGTESMHLREEIAPFRGVDRDLLIRKDTSREKLRQLKPVFDRSNSGTLTAGNSSPLTDGASAVLLMSETRAKEEGREIMAYITQYEYAAIAPTDGLLMAPGVAVPRLLNKAGLSMKDFDLIEIHEAFGAQVCANIKAWEEGWKGSKALGKVDFEKVNILGGSIAIGHPFAATGGRIVASLARSLKRNFLKRGLISICAAGAMAGAMILERE